PPPTPHPPSFPTRRSSDLPTPLPRGERGAKPGSHDHPTTHRPRRLLVGRSAPEATPQGRPARGAEGSRGEPAGRAAGGSHERGRSEEHTSELQSLAYLVCR